MNILLVEDDVELSKSIQIFLKMQNYNVDHFSNGLDAFNHLEENSIDYDLYLIDINIPNINGLELLQFIKKTKIDIPIVIITASLEVEDLQDAFRYGCSEYMKKPFNLKELEIRMNRILFNKIDILKLDEDFIYDKRSMDLKYKKSSIEFRKKEKLIIDVLLKNIGYIVSNEKIIDYVWSGEEKESYPIRQTINTIRKKLPIDIIKTEIGVGYKIES